MLFYISVVSALTSSAVFNSPFTILEKLTVIPRFSMEDLKFHNKVQIL